MKKEWSILLKHCLCVIILINVLNYAITLVSELPFYL